MGMAASQARLLTITARLADNELKSQTINNAKMRLATQSSQASENYINALNNATMKFVNYDETGETINQALTFNALSAYSSYNTQYGLVNSSGQILVNESEAKLFQAANGNLNAYLESHGLVYGTTYFDELGAQTNNDYPSPFNYISVEDMEIYYQGYQSYENSVEVQAYEDSYSDYTSTYNSLVDVGQDAMKKYLTGGTPTVSFTNSGSVQISNINGYDTWNMADNYKTNVTNRLADLVSKKFISESDRDLYMEKINSLEKKYNYDSATGNYIKVVNIYDNLDITSEDIVDGDGNITGKNYYFDADGNNKNIIIVDNNNIVQSHALLNTSDTTYSGDRDGITLAEFFQNLKRTDKDLDDNGNVTASYTKSFIYDAANNELKSCYSVKDLTELRNYLTELMENMIEGIINNAQYENFAKWIKTLNPYEINSRFGTELGATIISKVNAYTDAKDDFLGGIFKDTTQVESDLNDGQYTYTYVDDNGATQTETVQMSAKNLTDVDYVLTYMKRKGLEQSEKYNTILKEYLISNMIDINGEPKYAWIDVNDTANTGNAESKAQWFTNLFKRMQQGYKALENGLASSKEWIEFALESGIVSMEQVDKSFNWKSLDYKTCTRITEETDDAAVAKAEAEYTRAMNDIKAKDNIYDLQLKNIDTEHTTLQTELDVVKEVIKKNVDRTMKFNQSA